MVEMGSSYKFTIYLNTSFYYIFFSILNKGICLICVLIIRLYNIYTNQTILAWTAVKWGWTGSSPKCKLLSLNYN